MGKASKAPSSESHKVRAFTVWYSKELRCCQTAALHGESALVTPGVRFMKQVKQIQIIYIYIYEQNYNKIWTKSGNKKTEFAVREAETEDTLS